MKIRFDLSQDYIDVANFQSICFVTSMPIAQCLPFSQETGPNGDLSGNISWSHIFCRYIYNVYFLGVNSFFEPEVSDVDMSGTHCVSIYEKPEFPPYNLRLKNVSNPLPFFFSFLGRLLGFGTFFGHELNIK